MKLSPRKRNIPKFGKRRRCADAEGIRKLTNPTTTTTAETIARYTNNNSNNNTTISDQ